jgi:hypothetical protein
MATDSGEQATRVAKDLECRAPPCTGSIHELS